MDWAHFQDWLNRYVEAWKSYDPVQIGALFSDEVVYRYHPQGESVQGRAAVVASWIDNKDAPGTYDAKYQPLAIEGDVCVANGWSRYYLDGKLDNEYFNVYVCRFSAAGECTDFTEYWIQNHEFRKRDREELLKQGAANAAGTASAGG